MGHQHYCYLHGGFWPHVDDACRGHGSALSCPDCREAVRCSASGENVGRPHNTLPAGTLPPAVVLLVTSDCRKDAILEQLNKAGCTVLVAEECGAARQLLEREPDIKVVLTDLRLSDGTWDVILQTVAKKRSPANVVVILRGDIDKMYIDQHLDILEAGAYDVLAEPDVPAALQSVVAAAANGSRLIR